MARDYYEVLEVTRTCTEVELKTAFRKKAMQHHPDRNPGDAEAEVRFKECNEAYSVLADSNKRALYDRFGQDLRYDLDISLEQAYTGDELEVRFPTVQTCEVCEGSGAKLGATPVQCQTCHGAGRVRAQQGFFTVERTCPRCGGRGQMVSDPCRECHGAGQVRRERVLSVRIPPGVDDGARIRIAGEGDAGARGGPRGDLYIFVSVRAHELFERDGLDLHCHAPVPMCTAALGGEIEAPRLRAKSDLGVDDDGRVKVKVPEGAQTGKTVRLKGLGMPALRGRDRGDLIVELYVETPTYLTARQKELMRELAESCACPRTAERHHPQHASFLTKARKFWGELRGEDARV